MSDAQCALRARRPATAASWWRNTSAALWLGLCIGLAGFAALPALAQSDLSAPALSAEEFEAHVTGRTLTYAQYGQVYGTEEYLPGRRVRWQFSQDVCQYGSWYPRGDLICFNYEDQTSEHCWSFWRDGNGLKALSTDDAPGAELSEVAQSQQGLSCAGPDVGV